MADSKITDLTADTTPTGDDLIVTVNDPGGSPVNRKVTLTNLAASAPFTDAFAPRTALLAYAIGDGSGNHTTTSSTLADIAAAYSVTIAAAAGNRLEIELNGTFFHSAGSVFAGLCANVSGTGDLALQVLNQIPDTNSHQIYYRAFHVVQSGDISGGLVTVKPRWRVSGGTLTIANETTNNRKPVFSVQNHRH